MFNIFVVEGIALGIIGILGVLTYPRYPKPSYLGVISNWVGSYLDRPRRISLRYTSLKLIQCIKDDYLHEVEAERQYRIKKYKNNSFMDVNDIWIIDLTKNERDKLNQLMIRIFNNKFDIDPQDLKQLHSVAGDIFRVLKRNKERRQADD